MKFTYIIPTLQFYTLQHENFVIIFSNLTILQITTRIFFIKTHRISTLQYYTLHNKIFLLYIILLLTILQHYRLLPKFLNDYNWNILIPFQPYNITHYKTCVKDMTFIYDLTILHITLKLFWNCFFSVTKLHITSDCLFLF